MPEYDEHEECDHDHDDEEATLDDLLTAFLDPAFMLGTYGDRDIDIAHYRVLASLALFIMAMRVRHDEGYAAAYDAIEGMILSLPIPEDSEQVVREFIDEIDMLNFPPKASVEVDINIKALKQFGFLPEDFPEGGDDDD